MCYVNSVSPIENYSPSENENFDTDLAKTISRDGTFLTREVTHSDLTKLAHTQLTGRLQYYEREYLFERNSQIATEYKHEIDRTRAELERRKLVSRIEADRLFPTR